MSGWEKGNLALCVRGAKRKSHELHGYRAGQKPLRKGHIRQVEAVVWVNGVCGLVIEGSHSKQPHRAWRASAFIKVTPPADMIEETSRETVEVSA